MGILSLIPIKDWIYGGIIAALLIGGGIAWRKHDVHERAIGQQQIEAADAKLRAEVKKHNDDLQTAAADKSAAVEKQYESDIANPPATPAPSVVCVRPSSPHRNAVSAATSGSSGAGKGAQPGVSGTANRSADQIDIGAPLTVIGKDADAQIKALQADIQLLLNEMTGGK